jgi:thymidylate kinase
MKIKALEFLGLPGSGKTLLYNALIKKLRYQNIPFTTYKEAFFRDLYNRQKGIKKILFYLYLLYEKNYQFKSNYLFLSQYRLILSTIEKKKKLSSDVRLINNIYSNYINSSDYSLERRKRMKISFLIDLMGSTKKNIPFFQDEGFLQKVSLNYLNINEKIFKSKLNLYLNLISLPSHVIYVKTPYKTCFERADSRHYGFVYSYKNNVRYLKSKKSFENKIISFLRKKRVKIIVVRGKNNLEYNVNYILKKLFR